MEFVDRLLSCEWHRWLGHDLPRRKTDRDELAPEINMTTDVY